MEQEVLSRHQAVFAMKNTFYLQLANTVKKTRKSGLNRPQHRTSALLLV